MKRSYCSFLLPILVASAGCPNTDNNVGSLGQDAGAADGSGQVASDGPGQPADVAGAGQDAVPGSNSPDTGNVCLYPPGSDTSSDTGNGSFVGCRPGPASNFCDQSSYTMTCLGAGTIPSSIPEPASSLACAVLPIPTPSNTLFYCCPCASAVAVPDAGSVGQDAGQDAPEAGAAHQCQLNTDGTCSAVTPNTACTPFTGRRYDESAGCYAPVWTTLWCCATAAGDSCSWPPAIGCYQVATDGGTVTYLTPGLPPSSSPLPGGQTCDQNTSGTVTVAPLCSSTPADPNAEEAAIYAVLLGNTGGKLPIIKQQTATDHDGVSNTAQTVATVTSRITGVDPATISSFLAQNATAQSLRADMPLGTPYVLLSPTDPIWNDPNFWTTLRTRYPNGLSIPQGGMGYETFSRVGFNANMDQALVYMGTYAQMIAGTYVSFLEQGYYYLMKKVNGAWTIDQKTQTWTT